MGDGNSFTRTWPARLLSVLRIITAFLYMQHGAQKLFGFFLTPEKHAFPLFSFMGLGGVLEFFGGYRAKWRSPISWSTRQRVSGPY
jgi:putative oxidoreductase